MPFDSPTTQDIAPYEAYVCTDDGAALARAVVQSSGGSSADLHGGGLSGAARLSTGTHTARIILAEIGNIPVTMACECVTELRSCGADVIVLGAQTDITTYRALLKAGALKYFGFPVTPDEVLSIEPSGTEKTGPADTPQTPPQNTSLAVLGSNGGVGASLLAQNLAFHASAPKGAGLRTALIDADLQFGSQAIDLDRDETAGMFDALMSPERIDETFVSATMDHVTDRLSMYSNQVRIGQDALPYESGLAGILPPLRAEFDALITDLPRDTLMRCEGLSNHIDALILVIPAGFSGVNAATRLIERITARAPDLRILPVLSELRKDAGLSYKDIEKTIGRKLFATLPRNDAAIAKAHRAAKPLIQMQRRGPYSKAVSAIWNAATHAKLAMTPPNSRSLMQRVFK